LGGQVLIIKVKDQSQLYSSLDEIGLKEEIEKHKSVLIKINLARPAKVEHPRTDPFLLSETIKYIKQNQGTCAIAESANGYLRENLGILGLDDIIRDYKVEVIDLDIEDTDKVIVDGEEHYIPKCFKDYGVRIAIPATSKRQGMIFSNNIKLFVGAVPRGMYQVGDTTVDWRPRVHIDLHKSVANIYSAVQGYSPFNFYINGGLAMDETIGEFEFENILVADNALELDLYILNNIFTNHEIPDYIKKLQADKVCNK
jgi:uncharacterized protein (DUF362 family)